MRKILGTILFMLCLSMQTQAKVYEHTQGNRLTLLEDPAAAVDYKVELIKKAKHHINIITFFWDDTNVPKRLAEELNKANARGVEIRVLSTFISTIGVDFFGQGRKELDPTTDAVFAYLQLTPGTQFSLTHSLHEKIFLVDGELAILGGRNISDSSLSGKDMEVELRGPVVNQVQDHFKRMFDFIVGQKIQTNCASDETTKCEDSYKRMIFSENDKHFFPVQPAYEDGDEARILSHEAVLHQFEKGMNRRERLLQQDDILDTVTKIDFKKLRAYNYFMIPTKRYRDFLEKNLKEGDSIEIITNSLESAKFSNNAGYIYSLPDARQLVLDGIELYQWQRNQKLNYVHEKVLIFDEDHVIIGSHNFGTGSTSVSNEIAVEIKSKRIASRLIEVFEGEKENSAITKKADVELLDKEISQHERLIEIYRSKILGSVLREIY
nr:phosphatidylserine/phosphatidylglycerophosphate/cardiolipin synthase family protein [Bacteriovorax sp. HI3]